MKKSEKELDKALADALERDPALLAFVLSRTKFKKQELKFHGCRFNHPWGTHPFRQIDKETGSSQDTRRQSETDVLLLVNNLQGNIFAIHIENKLGGGAFTKLQPEMYPQRAAHWIDNPNYGGYSDFDTVLLAPSSFQERHKEQAAQFGAFISHEEISGFIPAFGEV